MPNPKLTFIPLAHRQQEAHTKAQSRPETLGLEKLSPYCECTVTTVLAKLRAEERPLCSDMPWRCPKKMMP